MLHPGTEPGCDGRRAPAAINAFDPGPAPLIFSGGGGWKHRSLPSPRPASPAALPPCDGSKPPSPQGPPQGPDLASARGGAKRDLLPLWQQKAGGGFWGRGRHFPESRKAAGELREAGGGSLMGLQQSLRTHCRGGWEDGPISLTPGASLPAPVWVWEEVREGSGGLSHPLPPRPHWWVVAWGGGHRPGDAATQGKAFPLC